MGLWECGTKEGFPVFALGFLSSCKYPTATFQQTNPTTKAGNKVGLNFASGFFLVLVEECRTKFGMCHSVRLFLPRSPGRSFACFVLLALYGLCCWLLSLCCIFGWYSRFGAPVLFASVLFGVVFPPGVGIMAFCHVPPCSGKKTVAASPTKRPGTSSW